MSSAYLRGVTKQTISMRQPAGKPVVHNNDREKLTMVSAGSIYIHICGKVS